MSFVEQRDQTWEQVEVNPMQIQRAHGVQRSQCATVIWPTVSHFQAPLHPGVCAGTNMAVYH